MGGWKSSAGARAAKIACRLFPIVLALWILLVLYPNPVRLLNSLERLAHPQVDPVAAQAMADRLPSDPAAIERAVLDALPYSYDWEVHSMPWYYPTVSEALAKHRGDCKARAIVLASILEAKGIPYRINSSSTHVWVEYSGKAETKLENAESRLYVSEPQTGTSSIRVPKIKMKESLKTFWEGFWPPMPVYRKVLLTGGPVMLALLRLAAPRLGRLADARLPSIFPTGWRTAA